MPSIALSEVDNYKVFVFRGSTGDQRWLQLRLKPTGHRVDLQFYSSPPSDWVSIGSTVSKIHLPLNRYDDMYHVLQTESPVYFQAFEFGTTRFAGITTDPEATGEGFGDAQAA